MDVIPTWNAKTFLLAAGAAAVVLMLDGYLAARSQRNGGTFTGLRNVLVSA